MPMECIEGKVHGLTQRESLSKQIYLKSVFYGTTQKNKNKKNTHFTCDQGSSVREMTLHDPKERHPKDKLVNYPSPKGKL